MTRYNDKPPHGFDPYYPDGDGETKFYREGVDRVLTYIESTHAYPSLLSELKWAIDEGII